MSDISPEISQQSNLQFFIKSATVFGKDVYTLFCHNCSVFLSYSYICSGVRTLFFFFQYVCPMLAQMLDAGCICRLLPILRRWFVKKQLQQNHLSVTIIIINKTPLFTQPQIQIANTDLKDKVDIRGTDSPGGNMLQN